MRTAFVKTLCELGASDPRIMLLTADLGFMALEPFAQAFPDRFINVGVAEQNLVGVATGLAQAGFLPFVYSIAPFASLRPYEFIRNGPVQHGLPVRIVAMGGGVDYGVNGFSHYALEDIGVMRIQPGLRVIAPADHEQVVACLRRTWDVPSPVYYRLEKEETAVVPRLDGRFEPGRIAIVREGRDCVVLSTGTVSNIVAQALDLLAKQNINCGHGIIAEVSPPPVRDILTLLRGRRLAVTVEAHYATGGIGSMVAECVAEAGIHCRLLRIGFASTIASKVGSSRFLLARQGISAEAIATRIATEIAA